MSRAGLAAFGLALALGGCGWAAVSLAPPGPSQLPPGRVLVLARVDLAANRPLADAVAALVLEALAPSGDLVGRRRLEAEAGPGGDRPWLEPLLARLEAGEPPLREEARRLADRFALAAVLFVDVAAFEQAWTAGAKLTRVSLEALAFDLRAFRVLWRARGDAAVEAHRGRAFARATALAVEELAHAIHPRRPTVTAEVRWPLLRGLGP